MTESISADRARGEGLEAGRAEGFVLGSLVTGALAAVLVWIVTSQESPVGAVILATVLVAVGGWTLLPGARGRHA